MQVKSTAGARRSRRATIPALLAAIPLITAGLAGCATTQDQIQPTKASSPASSPVGSSSYSMTQIVNNHSTQPLTLTANRVDNGGTLQPGYATVIGPGTSHTYKATNEGNGVQLWLTFTTTGGATFTTDSDTPRRDTNNTTAKISGPGLGLDSNTNTFSVTDGDNATATVAVEDCTSGCTLSLTTCGVAGC